MVRLTKIYTKTGDNGTTGLANGFRAEKAGILMEAIGAVDEANSAIGMVHTHYDLSVIQNTLFDIGAILAGSTTVEITEDSIFLLENNIDELNEQLPTLQSFILPKGDIHNARAVVRRAERDVWYWYATDMDGHAHNDFDPNMLVYLNRLSDYLFVLARYDSALVQETLWKPMGKNEQ